MALKLGEGKLTVAARLVALGRRSSLGAGSVRIGVVLSAVGEVPPPSLAQSFEIVAANVLYHRADER